MVGQNVEASGPIERAEYNPPESKPIVATGHKSAGLGPHSSESSRIRRDLESQQPLEPIISIEFFGDVLGHAALTLPPQLPDRLSCVCKHSGVTSR